ncbi:hypothetical protein ACODNH_00590 (plasmid) [Haloarcula sp. NS06]|uniref:Uncharacterized protein n=1 Tax=Haloarcula argentinensis TaxID=43776 RepID=A0A847UNE3_HALAR|nr:MULTISPECIES: hypothetical protein [Haloarcula]KAA9400585.1 hypothetical protein Har1131_17965 [Haloarcula sp. CBA1131]NLV14056.1 hypothetical protein [Haloarcula argentinensis]
MGADTDDEVRSERYDIHNYIKEVLDKSEFDADENPLEMSDVIRAAASRYVVEGNSDDIADYEYHYITAVRIADNISRSSSVYKETARDMYNEFEESHDDLNDEEIEAMAEDAGKFTIGNNLTVTYSMAYELLDDLMEEAMPLILPEEDRKKAGGTLKSQVNEYFSKQQLLGQCGVVSEETASTIQHIGGIRHDVVHDVEERFTLDTLDGDMDRIDEIPGAVNEVYELVYGEPAYQYVDE